MNTARPIANEPAIMRRLRSEGWQGNADQVRIIAAAGDALRKRYENACSYQWATTEAYSAQTERLEAKLHAYCSEVGLNLYIQGDPRGATAYVRPVPHEIRSNAYNSDAVCVYFEREEQP